MAPPPYQQAFAYSAAGQYPEAPAPYPYAPSYPAPASATYPSPAGYQYPPRYPALTAAAPTAYYPYAQPQAAYSYPQQPYSYPQQQPYSYPQQAYSYPQPYAPPTYPSSTAAQQGVTETRASSIPSSVGGGGGGDSLWKIFSSGSPSPAQVPGGLGQETDLSQTDSSSSTGISPGAVANLGSSSSSKRLSPAKRAQIAAQMQALRESILSDFSATEQIGKKACEPICK
ncbi:hypothetical protein GUITHDRAFT_163801 [Guillardia theta CCMP2712]|uniref:Uncharacterized protein n=1 Tax=Guillardia theta (strain CCMP2712) TaxID=905079 RepID=L1J672_GUITC|nr:hypothetical protein GUITHDRAFT_163801 [Guillardia theta CCMP2712]EKX43595.1 hypothetical protein GUITHDRAFT_163801 [Guillardia theta CCMP2712]|eukprot:XP_005830575.1 hypothetical protein GUITHDRAFT_163801 [Guillardia theta CCMP2712]